MRCDCCGRKLNDYESSIKGKLSGQYLNTCVSCLKTTDIEYVGNKTLKYKRPEDGEEFDEEVKPLKLEKPNWRDVEEEE